MTKEEIKYQVYLYQQDIKHGTENLEAIRKQCKHEETFEGNWSWRTAAISPATICSICGTCIKLHYGVPVVLNTNEQNPE